MHLLHEITSFGASLQPCSYVGWGRQQQDPGEPGRCGVGSASSGSPAPGQWGRSACSASAVSEGPQHPPEGLGWAAPPHCCIPGLPAEGGCIGRIREGTMRSGAVWSGPAPKLGAGLLLLPKHTAGRAAPSQVWVSAALPLAHQPTSGSLTGTEMKTNPTILDSA